MIANKTLTIGNVSVECDRSFVSPTSAHVSDGVAAASHKNHRHVEAFQKTNTFSVAWIGRMIRERLSIYEL